MNKAIKKNIEARVAPVTVFVMLLLTSLFAMFVMLPTVENVKGATTSDFSNYINLSVVPSQVSGTQSNFAVLVYNSSCTALDGLDDDDFAFFDVAGNELPWELVEWNDTTDTLEAWVNVSSLSSSTSIHLWYEDVADVADSDGGEYLPTSVWDSHYRLVLHMTGGSATDIDDSTSNNNDVIGDEGSPAYNETGQVGKCVRFDGSAVDTGDDLRIADSSTLSFGDATNDDEYTFEVWVNADDISSDDRTVFSKYGTTKEYQAQLRGSDTRAYIVDESVGVGQSASSSAIPTNSWVYVVYTYDGQGGGDAYQGMLNYINGTAQSMSLSTDVDTYVAMQDTPVEFQIGARQDDKNYFDGHIDEIHLSDINRSASWILTKYNMMNNKTNFFTWNTTSSSSSCSLILHGNPSGNRTYTLQGEAGQTKYANESGTYYQTGEFNFTIVGTEYFERLTVNVSDITNGVIDGNDIYISFDDDNSSWSGNWHQCSDGGESIIVNGTNWDANNWMSGTNPFTADGDSDGYKEIQSTSSIWMRVRIDIPADATNTTHANYAMTWDAGKMS